MGWSYLALLLIVSGVLCGIGFYKFVYFLSIGYGFAVGGIGIAIAILGILDGGNMNLELYLLCTLLLIYGVRLSGFLLAREFKNKAYQKVLNDVVAPESKMPLLVKVAIWISVAVLYVGQTSGVFYRYYNGGVSDGFGWAGIVICIAALILESTADMQKTRQKKERPDMVAMKGLYRIVRCPNYLGEILFWTGIFLSGWGVLRSTGQWALAIIAYVCIVYVMFDGAKRLEKRQMKRYRDHEEYNTYANHTPILIPLVPLYHLNRKN